MGLVLIKERRILFSEFALSKSQYLYNKSNNIMYVDVNSLKLRSVFPLCRVRVKFYVLQIRKNPYPQYDIEIFS